MELNCLLSPKKYRSRLYFETRRDHGIDIPLMLLAPMLESPLLLSHALGLLLVVQLCSHIPDELSLLLQVLSPLGILRLCFRNSSSTHFNASRTTPKRESMTPYHNAEVFCMCQTQLSFSLPSMLSDSPSQYPHNIFPVNPRHIAAFCALFDDLPPWRMLHIGVNQQRPSEVQLRRVPKHSSSEKVCYF